MRPRSQLRSRPAISQQTQRFSRQTTRHARRRRARPRSGQTRSRVSPFRPCRWSSDPCRSTTPTSHRPARTPSSAPFARARVVATSPCCLHEPARLNECLAGVRRCVPSEFLSSRYCHTKPRRSAQARKILARTRPRHKLPHSSRPRYPSRVSSPASLPVSTRLWLAWVCFFRILFDGLFAARVFQVREAPAIEPPPEPAKLPDKPAPEKPKESDTTAALQLLALLQREGRLVDFLQQDIATFPDAEIGAAVRVVHEGCRKALRDHVDITPIRQEDEGANITLESGFSASEVKLTGDVKGKPPYRGTLQHRGWKANHLKLPKLTSGHDSSILAPAEVEL